MSHPLFRSAALLASLATLGVAADISSDIHVNQVGYLTSLPKLAVVSNVGEDSSFTVITEPGGEVAYQGFGKAKGYWSSADDTARILDFSGLIASGTYRIQVPGKGVSHPFAIGPDALTPITKAAIKSYYFQRSSTALPSEFAGVYARPAGHPDTAVRIHKSAATETRKANSLIRSPKGWYDAGDYGKYIVNSGITVWTLLDAYLLAPRYFDTLDLNIPESGNQLPDLLDEALWNIDWMLTMQDEDGGVYHKLTTPTFPGFVMPASDRAARYVVVKTTAATLDFAAVMAQTSRIFRRFEAQRPGFADSCLNAAVRAWNWALANPKAMYRQDTLSSPTISTGTYSDGSVADEKQWAALELTLATRRDSFWLAAYTSNRFVGAKSIPGWGMVSPLGLMSALSSIDSLVGLVDTVGMRTALRNLADEAPVRFMGSPYAVPVSEDDMYWGSTAVTGNIALTAFHWYRISRDTSYRNAAAGAVDWILGRNPLGVSFVTGFGSVTPQRPHHRPSGADSIVAPIPGFVVGGPNNGREDQESCVANGVDYASLLPALSWLDHQCSYASNEVAINWNAPLAALLGSLQAGELDEWKVISVDPRRPSRVASRVSINMRDGLRVSTVDGSPIQEIRVSDVSGRTLLTVHPGTSQWSSTQRFEGVVLLGVRTLGGWTTVRATGF